MCFGSGSSAAGADAPAVVLPPPLPFTTPALTCVYCRLCAPQRPTIDEVLALPWVQAKAAAHLPPELQPLAQAGRGAQRAKWERAMQVGGGGG